MLIYLDNQMESDCLRCQFRCSFLFIYFSLNYVSGIFLLYLFYLFAGRGQSFLINPNIITVVQRYLVQQEDVPPRWMLAAPCCHGYAAASSRSACVHPSAVGCPSRKSKACLQIPPRRKDDLRTSAKKKSRLDLTELFEVSAHVERI